MKNLFISDLHNKDVEHFTTNTGLTIRRKIDKPFKKMCNVFTNANIIHAESGNGLSDEEYFDNLSLEYVPLENYPIQKGKNNIGELIDLFNKKKVKYGSITSSKPTLNDVFLELTGKDLRD